MNGAGSAYARPSRRRKFLPPRARIARELERGNEQRGEDALARRAASRRPTRARAVEQRDALLVHRIEPAREHRLEQLFLAAEVIVDRGEVDPRCGSDQPAGASKPCSMNSARPRRGCGCGWRSGRTRSSMTRTAVSNACLNANLESAAVKRRVRAALCGACRRDVRRGGVVGPRAAKPLAALAFTAPAPSLESAFLPAFPARPGPAPCATTTPPPSRSPPPIRRHARASGGTNGAPCGCCCPTCGSSRGG